MLQYTVTALPVSKTLLGEGPHWDEKSKKLYYVDILRNTVFSYDPVTSIEAKIVIEDVGEGENSVGFVVPVHNVPNKFIVGVGRSLRVLEWDGVTNGTASNLKTLHVVLDNNANGRFNDAKCDNNGRLWAGTMGKYEPGKIDALEKKKGQLYKLDADGALTTELKDVDLSNGLAWTKDNKTMYYIDSIAFSVDAFDFNETNGTISNRRVVFDLKENNVLGFPDGMCIDERGNLWVAVFSSAKVININPTTGKLLGQIGFEATNITSVAFGGPDLDVLYVTSAQNDLTPEKLQKQPLAGRTFKVTGLGVRGAAAGVAYRGNV